jgi:large subunit ribosomal protein L21
MYAIVKIAGQQQKVEAGKWLFVHRLEAEKDAKITFNEVMLVDNDGNVTVGTPNVSGATVTGTVIDPLVKGDKVIVFKKKRRKGYRVKKGHRQQFTKLLIDAINA